MRRRLPLLLALWAAFALRLFQLDAQSIWWDEGISLHLGTSSLLDIAQNRAANIHPPLYFWSLKGWLALVGVGAFHGRFLSVLASLLQVAALYAVARRWFGPGRTTWLALALIITAPISILYGQEIRAYALLPVVYFLLFGLTQQIIREQGRRRPPLLALALVEWTGLHLHYIVVFLVIYLNGWVLAHWLAGRRRTFALRPWLLAQTAVFLASLPWAAAVLWRWNAVQAEANAGTYLTDPAPIPFLLSQVGVFHLTGLPSVLSQPLVRWLAAAALALFLLLLAARLAQPATRRPAAALLLHWLLPLSMAVVVWSIRSFSHPRYILMYTVGLVPLLAYLIWPPRAVSRKPYSVFRKPYSVFRKPYSVIRKPNTDYGLRITDYGSRLTAHGSRLTAAALAATLFALAFWALNAYFFDPDLAQNDDMRGVAHFLQATAAPADLILIPETDWSLPFEYAGDAFIGMPTVSDPAQLWAELAAWTQTRRRVFTVTYPRSAGPDWQQAVPFALESAGSLVAETQFDGLRVREYRLETAVSPPPLRETHGRFPDLTLTAAWLEPAPPANNGVAVALQWQPGAPTAAPYVARLQLHDVDGWPLAGTDVLLLDPRGRPTTHWPAAEPVLTYAFLPLPAATPPLSYTLRLELGAVNADSAGLRMLDLLNEQGNPQGRALPLGEVALRPVDPAAGSPYAAAVSLPALPAPAPLSDGLLLRAASVDRAEVGPGQSLFVQLLWENTGAGQTAVTPDIQLVQNGEVLAAAAPSTLFGRYPLQQWRAGEQAVEHRDLVAPPGASGAAEVVVALGDARISLGTVHVTETAYQFTPPPTANPLDVTFGDEAGAVARLAGFELPDGPFSAADGVPLTLVWESLTTGTAASYTVFTHLIAPDGRLVGQHDAPPRSGQRPTTGWVAGEYLVDPHPLALREPYQGAARLAVGLYNPATGARLHTPAGADAFYLPVTLQITDE